MKAIVNYALFILLLFLTSHEPINDEFMMTHCCLRHPESASYKSACAKAEYLSGLTLCSPHIDMDIVFSPHFLFQ